MNWMSLLAYLGTGLVGIGIGIGLTILWALLLITRKPAPNIHEIAERDARVFSPKNFNNEERNQ